MSLNFASPPAWLAEPWGSVPRLSLTLRLRKTFISSNESRLSGPKVVFLTKSKDLAERAEWLKLSFVQPPAPSRVRCKRMRQRHWVKILWGFGGKFRPGNDRTAWLKVSFSKPPDYSQVSRTNTKTTELRDENKNRYLEDTSALKGRKGDDYTTPLGGDVIWLQYVERWISCSVPSSIMYLLLTDKSYLVSKLWRDSLIWCEWTRPAIIKLRRGSSPGTFQWTKRKYRAQTTFQALLPCAAVPS